MKRQKIVEDFQEEKYYDEEEVHENKNNQNDDDVDPLDLYMADMEKQFQQDLTQGNTKNKKQEEEVFENEDPLESQMDQIKQQLIKYVQIQKYVNRQSKKKTNKQNKDSDSDQSIPFIDSDGEVDFEELMNQKKSKHIEPLPQLDHSKIEYPEFDKNFYIEHQDITELQNNQVEKIRKEYEIKVKGNYPPKPIVSFAHLNFDQRLIDKIISQNFTKPTAIQAQALPCVLSGRNVIGVAKTGSGKTLAYAWPMLLHVADQRAVEKKEGPIALTIVPTRELGQQVFLEVKKYAQLFDISVSALLGGENKHFQWKELRSGVDIVIATPGRLIEMIKKKATNMQRCTYVVLDEADQMFSLGFEYQIRSILGQIRPDRQMLLFTATMKKKIKQLCIDMLEDPIVITIGENENQVNEDIKQIPVILEDEETKLKWLINNISNLLQNGKVLIFVSQIGQCETLLKELQIKLGVFGCTLHGDKLQQERTKIINQFKTKTQLMIATDIASRGLDIKEIRTVINYYPPKDADIYVHRIGRTGRAGNCDGEAYTLVTKTDWKTAILLIKNLELAGQVVSKELEDIACIDSKFNMLRLKKRMGFEYAKGRDASKMLQQALKRQRNSKVGLGYNENEPKKTKKVVQEDDKIDEQERQYIQIQQVAPTLAQYTKSVGQFKNKWEEVNPYDNYTNYAATITQDIDNREYVIQQYQNKMRDQFRSQFKSAGAQKSKLQGPTVKFLDDKQQQK